MISRTHRFRGFRSLRFVYSRGRVVRGPLFSIKALVNPRRDAYRAAVVVSRKVSKSAVVRNRIRRRVFESIRAIEADINSQADIVITIFSDSVKDEPTANLKRQLKKQLAEADVLRSGK